MTLVADLFEAKTEEDVKDAYIKALSLKKFTKGLIDIQTKEVWFEAKDVSTPPAAMFSQLLSYVNRAHKIGEPIPPFLAVIDREKAALMETLHALPLFKDKTIEWGTAASQISKKTIAQIQPYIEAHFVVYKISTNESEFIQAVKAGIKEGRIIRTPITPDNLKQVFDKWVEMVGLELDDVRKSDYALLFYADIMHDGKNKVMDDLPARLLYEGDRPIFMFGDKTYELASVAGYRQFWAIYHRPPHQEYRARLLERRDSLLPIDERSFKGAYYTPLKIVDKAYNLLTKTLGKNWQENYIVWDMCCGVGNLEVKHSNQRNVFMSTLDKADIDVMKASRTCVAATHFQYDYLNDDIDDFGQIDYLRTKKLPKELRQYISDSKDKKKGAKKILVLMNPPYAEATNSDNVFAGLDTVSKTGVAKTRIGQMMETAGFGYAARELFVQFMVRIQSEIPNATLAMFSTLKYVNASNFELFRLNWKAKYLSGFVVHSKAFDGLNGNFPIGFLVWDTSKKEVINEIEADVIDKDGNWVGKKSFFNLPSSTFLNAWLPRIKTNATAIPLKNAVHPQLAKAKVTTWVDSAIAYFWCNGNDMQQANQTAIFSSVFSAGNGYYVTPENLWKAAVVFSVRRLIKPVWLNDRDQFLQPTAMLSQSFKSDCLVWMLFHGSNLTASANNLEWNGKKWSIVNHFIPFTEAEVNARGRFESRFMSDYLKGKVLSKEAKAVMDSGRAIWKAYFSTEMERRIRDELKLNRSDVGWYQIRKALEAKNGAYSDERDSFQIEYDKLTAKLRPAVYELGFLR